MTTFRACFIFVLEFAYAHTCPIFPDTQILLRAVPEHVHAIGQLAVPWQRIGQWWHGEKERLGRATVAGTVNRSGF